MTIAEMLALSIEERKQKYKAIDIDKVIIDGNVFTDYRAFSFLWEKSYVKSPERSGDGTIGNLNSYATFVTPHLKVDFSMMSIDSYRKIMSLLYEKNEHIVQCYDIIQNKVVTNNMYFATEEMPKLWTIARALNGEKWVELLGVQDYTVELIGTNTNFEIIKLRYNLNKPSNVTWGGTTLKSIEVAKNTSVLIGKGAISIIESTVENESDKTYNYEDITFDNNYIFNGWNTEHDGTGLNYINGEEYYLMGDTELFAQWKKTT